MKDNKVEIKRIIIKIGDKEHSLTSEQAKELSDILNQLFKNEEKSVSTLPYYPPICPIYIEQEIIPWWKQWTVTCGGSEGTNAGTLLLFTNYG